MADRTAAGIFGKIFDILAKHPTEQNITTANELWTKCDDYDFTIDQMNCDSSLLNLGLARIDPDNENWVLYNV